MNEYWEKKIQTASVNVLLNREHTGDYTFHFSFHKLNISKDPINEIQLKMIRLQKK